MYPKDSPLCDLLSPALVAAHQNAWLQIANPGDFFTAAQRIEFVRLARLAQACEFCQQRKAALSPGAVTGEHLTAGDSASSLSPVLVDVIHRLRSDPGRLTKTWFDEVSQQLGQREYVELVSVVCSSVIVDTLHVALGLDLPELPQAQPGQPRGEYNTEAVDIGAWVPVVEASQTLADTGLPAVPNIARALGLVPSAVALFFGTFRPHYALKDIALSISQAQAEFVASRVSALNECFY